MFKRIRSESGFTLVELLVVLAIMAILIAIVVPNLAGLTGGARGTAARTELAIVQTAMDSFMTDHDAITVAAMTGAVRGSGTEVTYKFVSGIDGDTGEEEYTYTGTATLRLRTTTTGLYSWTDEGAVTQDEYPIP